MKKWEEERKKKQYAQKINAAKSTLKTQPKGVRSTNTMSHSGHQQNIGRFAADSDSEYYQNDEIYSNMIGNQISYDQFQEQMGLNFPSEEQMASAGHIGMFNQDYVPSPMQMSNQRQTQKIQARQSQGFASGNSSQYAKPKLMASQNTYVAPGSKKQKQFDGTNKISSVKRVPPKSTPNLPDLPIYKLLKAFKLQQYTLKMNDLGYGHDVYKLALLSSAQREDFVNNLKVMPGHKAKIAGFFSVIDDVYPRQKVMEQINSATPGKSIAAKKKRIQSANRTKYHLGPQKTLLQQYEKLNNMTKMQFNQNFLMNLEKVQVGQLISQHVNLDESSKAINQIFPPDQYLGSAALISQGLSQGYSQQMENLVNKFSKGPEAQQMYQKLGDQQRKKSAERRVKDIDRITMEVEKKLKLQRKQEKDRIKQYGEIYGGPQFAHGGSGGTNRAPSTTKSRGSKSRDRSSGKVKRKQSKLKQQQVNEYNPNQVNLYDQKNQVFNLQKIQPDENEIMEQLEQLSIDITTGKNDKYELPEDETENSIDKIQISQDISNQTPSMFDGQIMDQTQKSNQFEDTTGGTSGVDMEAILQKKQQQLEEESYNEISSPLQEEDESNAIPLNADDLYERQDFSLDVSLELKPDLEEDQSEDQYSVQTPSVELNGQTQTPKTFKEFKKLAHPEPNKKLSPLLDANEKQEAWNLGQSLDSKKITSALGYLDLKQICYCLAQALLRHIEFSSGHFFVEDMKQCTDVEFSYNLGKGMKIDLEAAKLKQQQKEEKQLQIQRDFEDLKKQMEESKELPKKTPKLTNNKCEELSEEDIADETPGGNHNKDKYIEDYYEDDHYSQEDHYSDEDEDEEKMDMDYSQSQLEDFLKSQSNKGLNSQQLLNSFVTTYNKTKAGYSKNSLAVSNKLKSNEKREDVIEEEQSNNNDEDDDIERTPEVINLNEVSGNNDNDQFDMTTKEGFKELMRFQMRIFDSNYDFENDELVGGPYQGPSPSLEELYYFCKYVIISGRMEKEIPILCLVYLERFLTKSGLLMNFSNWKRLTLISLILASKIWDDDSLENVHFPQVMGDISLKEITGLEKVFLQLVDFDLVIKGSEYAKYYFILKAFAVNFNSTLPMGPLSVPEMSHLQNNTQKAETELREKYMKGQDLGQSVKF